MAMGYEEAKKRIRRLNKDEKAGKIKNKVIKKNLVGSYYNSLKLGEGDNAVKSLRGEIRQGNKVGAKSRGNWQIVVCLKKCANRDIECDDCIMVRGKYTKYKPLEEDKEK